MLHRPLAATAAALAIGAGLAGCYVVPIDTRTGQPYPMPTGTAPSTATAAPQPAVGAIATAPAVIPVRLYPLNAQANKAGLLAAQVLDNNAGKGTFSVGYLGDTLQGETTRVDAGYAAFGRVHQQVLGTTARTFTGRRGIANAYGARGVNAQCEYVLTGPGTGTGVCQFSDGAAFQMHFGA